MCFQVRNQRFKFVPPEGKLLLQSLYPFKKLSKHTAGQQELLILETNLSELICNKKSPRSVMEQLKISVHRWGFVYLIVPTAYN